VDEIQIDEVVFKEDGGLLLNDGGFGGGGFGHGNSSTHWIKNEAPRKLREALARLELPDEPVQRPELVLNMGRHEMNNEKKRVKMELKRYDTEFRQHFERLPTRTEKEPMRPLYAYYRKLKTMIAQQDKARRSSVDRGRMQPGLTSIPDEETPDLEETTPRANAPRGSVGEQITTLEGRLLSLANEKNVVRAKLQMFQDKFVAENNRKIRFHKDILPIERDYRMYKHLKEEMQKVEMQLRDLREGEDEGL
jgi:hypothetical protein